MNKPVFNPNEPFTVPSQAATEPMQTNQKPAFDPNQDFEAVGSEKYGSPLEMAKTAVEQGLSGATLGLSSVLEEKLFKNAKERAAREEENPELAVGSNIAGAVLGSMVGPELLPVRALQTAGKATEAALGATKAAKIITPALEGAVFGGVTTMTDDWSKNKPLDAQKIVANAGIGALLGGGTSSLIEGVKLTGKGISGTMEKLKEMVPNPDLMDLRNPSWSNEFKAAVNLSEKDPNQYINNLGKTLEELITHRKEAVNLMYENTGKDLISKAIDNANIDTTQAKQKAYGTIDKIMSLIRAPMEEEGAEGFTDIMTPKATGAVQNRLNDLSKKVEEASKPMQVHKALAEFATEIDNGNLIKFERPRKFMSDIEMKDQDVLYSVRDAIRGDLKNPNIWKDAAPIYGEMSSIYSQLKPASKQFQKDFMKARETAKGKVYELDYGKLKTFFSNMEEEGQKFKKTTLDNFINSVTDATRFGENTQAFTKANQELVDNLEKIQLGLKSSDAQAKMMAVLKEAKKGHGLSLGTLAAIESLPIPHPVKALAIAIARYSGEGGGYNFGHDFNNVFNATKKLSEVIDTTTQRIDKASRKIFYGERAFKD